MSVTGYVALLTRQVVCQEFSRCYDDVNICLWTDGSLLTQSAAQTPCQRRNSFLPRITNSNIQSKLAEFRSAAWNLLSAHGFCIDLYTFHIDTFHWIDGSQVAGWSVSMHELSGLRPWRILAYNQPHTAYRSQSHRMWIICYQILYLFLCPFDLISGPSLTLDTCHLRINFVFSNSKF